MIKRLQLLTLLACTGLMQASQKESHIMLNAVRTTSGKVVFMAAATAHPSIVGTYANADEAIKFAAVAADVEARMRAEKAAKHADESGFGSGFKKGFLNKKKK